MCCVCVGKLYVGKLCVGNLCVGKLYVGNCVRVCEQVACE